MKKKKKNKSHTHIAHTTAAVAASNDPDSCLDSIQSPTIDSIAATIDSTAAAVAVAAAAATPAPPLMRPSPRRSSWRA
jgi:hypothetical protein